MSGRIRIKRRLLWISAAVPAVGLGVFVSMAVLLANIEPAARGERPERLVTKQAPTESPAPAGWGVCAPTAAAAAPELTSETQTTTRRDVAEAELVLTSGDTTLKQKRAALRLLVAQDKRAAARFALGILDGGSDGPLALDALRALASVPDNAWAERSDLGRFLLEALSRARSSEFALACGAALDSLPASALSPEDLVRALGTAQLPEARVAILRTLVLEAPLSAEATLARVLNADPAPEVRAEALELLASRRDARSILSVRDRIVGDAALRAEAPRALAAVPGPEIDEVLVEAFLAERMPAAQKNLAQALARRGAVLPAVAMSETQVRALRDTTARRSLR